ncbi:hypothetical protein TWF281_000054 [Arthrobotrys megalospora]
MSQTKPTKYHLKATSNYSPVFDALNMGLHNTVFNGSLFSLNTSGIFRQSPSPEVDAAWESITRVPNFLVNREDIEKVGKDPKLVVKAPAAWNVGEKYLVALEGHHTMHCLNEIRREVYSDYYFGANEAHYPLRWVHIAHCLDIIRQSLMCSVSVDLISSNWVETQKSPYPDFNVAHQCRDFDAIMGWAQKQQSDARYLERVADLRDPPADAVILPMDPAYYDLLPALDRYDREHGTETDHQDVQGHHHGSGNTKGDKKPNAQVYHDQDWGSMKGDKKPNAQIYHDEDWGSMKGDMKGDKKPDVQVYHDQDWGSMKGDK